MRFQADKLFQVFGFPYPPEDTNSPEETAQPLVAKKSRLFFRNNSAQWFILGLMISAYLILFFYYYPVTHGIEDEVGFINQALVWSKGAITAEGAGFQELDGFIEVKGRHIAWRNPGRSILILPLLLAFGVKSIFVSGALIHIALTLVTALILARLGISPLYASLVLYHPTLALYSRTIMGDAPAGLFLLLSMLALLSARRPGKWAGLAVGCAAVMRYQAGVALPFLALAMFFNSRLQRPRCEAFQCLIAGGMIASLIVGYNLWMYGNATGSVNGGANHGYFDLSFVIPNGIFYAAALLVVWPGMLLAPFSDNSSLRWQTRALAWPVLALLLPYYFYDQGSSLAQTLVVGQRLLQPALPIWMVSYIIVINKRLAPKLKSRLPDFVLATIAIVIGITCSAAQVVMFRQHQHHLLGLKAVRDWVSDQVPPDALIISNRTLAKLFGVPVTGVPRYRWKDYDYFGLPLDQADTIKREKKSWFLATLAKSTAAQSPPVFSDYLMKYKMTKIEGDHTGLILYKSVLE